MNAINVDDIEKAREALRDALSTADSFYSVAEGGLRRMPPGGWTLDELRGPVHIVFKSVREALTALGDPP